jgi:pimeloyl-ACP methyl ester carboxylesterase
MPRRSKLAILCGAVVVAAASVLSFVLAIHSDGLGRLHFRLWRAVSTTSHGGCYVEINGVKLHYETFGDGLPAVVVLHGGLGSIVDMHNQIRALAERRMVVAIDSRGHGRSSDGALPLSYGLMADDTFKLLESLGLRTVDIVGWSDGGIIGLDLAMHHPELVRRLVAIGANFNPDGLVDGQAPDTLAGPIVTTPAQNEGLNTLQRKVTTMWHTGPNYTVQDLATIRAPTLIIAGERDVVRRQHTDALANAVPGAREVIIADSTHDVPIEKPNFVDLLLLDFLNEPAPLPR